MDHQALQTATSHISPAPAKQELQPSRTGELEQALNAPKVQDAPIDMIEAVLRRVMLMIGLRAQNLPNVQETQILISFIQKKFGLLTVAEILLAFEKAVAGELEIETASCFENFSCEYFGRIMAAYKKWASRQWNENQMYLVKPQTENLITMPADWKPLYEMYYQDYLNGKFNIRVMPWEVYLAAVELGHMESDAYEGWFNEAKADLIAEYKIEMSEAFKSISENERHELSEKIRKLENGELEFKVIELAKKLAVEFLYKTAKKQNRKQLFGKQ